MIFISILILIVAIALPSFRQSTPSILFIRISSIIFLYAGALSFNACYIQSIGSGIGIYSGLFHITLISQLLDTFIFIIGSLVLIAWPNQPIISASAKTNAPVNTLALAKAGIPLPSLDGRAQASILTQSTEYSLIVLFSLLGASLLISSADLISMYLSIELQSFGVYILATLYRDSESATSAGLKYFLLGGLSSCIILLGAGLVYTFTGLTNLESIYSLISVTSTPTILQGFSLGFILIIIGFLFKIAAAPLHNWAPDVYDESPTIVTIWLTIMPKISIIVLLLALIETQIGASTIYQYSFNILSMGLAPLENIGILNPASIINNGDRASLGEIRVLLLLSSLLSLIIGTVVGLAQTKIKRLLAYSTISHIGFILLALAINTEQSIDSLIFYIVQYTITNLNTFLIIIALGYTIHSVSINQLSDIVRRTAITQGDSTDIRLISDLKGQFFSNPLLSISLSICLFSMAGIPPLVGFFSKQFVLYSAVQSGYYFMAIVAIIVSVISASYYLKIIRLLHTAAKPDTEAVENSMLSLEGGPSSTKSDNLNLFKLSNFHSFLISSLTLTILLFVLKPSIILNSTQLLSLTLFNY